TVLYMEKINAPIVDLVDESLFFEIVRAAFFHRRKNLKNNLYAHFQPPFSKDTIQAILDKSEIEGTRRGESLSIQEFAHLANVACQFKCACVFVAKKTHDKVVKWRKSG